MDDIVVVSFPLPSASNYVLLANLIAILSHVYKAVHVVTGNLLTYPAALREIAMYRGRGGIYIYDIGLSMAIGRGVATYIAIQLRMFACMVCALVKTRGPVLFFIGVPHVVHLILVAKMLRRKTIYY